MQVQYSTDELVHMISSNNLSGVYARLLAEGRVNAAVPPNVDAISYAIQEQAARLSPEAFLQWLEQLLDVPVNPANPFTQELRSITRRSGKTPARFLTDQIRYSISPDKRASPSGARWPSWLFIALALIGALSLLVAIGRWIGKKS